jgi:hypothetical protein
VSPAAAAQESAAPTAIVDSAKPANDSAQKGKISRTGSLASRRPHVQRRFRPYDGTVATDVAITFASHAAIPKTAVPVAKIETLITVVNTETLMQRVSFWTSVRRSIAGAMALAESAARRDSITFSPPVASDRSRGTNNIDSVMHAA